MQYQTQFILQVLINWPLTYNINQDLQSAMGRPQRKSKSLYKRQQKEQKPKQTEKQQQQLKQQKEVVKKSQQQNNQDKQKVESENKTKVIVKAKQYKRKSAQQQKRINKSKKERIFLLTAQRFQHNWTFNVQGTTGSQYYVYISTHVSCSCMDFMFKKIPCKHIYFIVTQVGQNDQLLNYFKKDRKISANAYKILDQQLVSRLKSRLQKPSKDPKDIDLKDQTDCVICFTQMDKQNQNLQDCQTCKKYFHSQCISAWKSHNASCPLCRGSLIVSSIIKGETGDDPLGKLVGIHL